LTLELDIDGFPRVFVVKVPCWRSNSDIPVVSDFQRIEIVDPPEGRNIGPDDKNQRVRLKIDAIPGSFETKRDYVEVGWDLDRDREFAEETTFKFAADRQVDVMMNSISNGRVTLTANVTDISFDLPPPSLKNDRVNLLAKLSAGGEMVWSKPIEVVVDSDPPTVTGVEIMPGTTFALGVDLMVRVGVDDAKLSGIESVELLVDSKGIGEFTPASGVPKACDRQSDGSWTLTLPTTDLLPGRATLLVRATDRVGNKSEVSKTVLSVLSEQEWQERLKRMIQELSGMVSYLDNPLPDAKVTLEDEKGAFLHRTKTDVRGAFRLPGVQPGKYKVVATGVVKNRPRKAEQTFEVGVPPAPPTRLRLQAK
ncbi:MAG: carboxypeptidase-like regulatory domain-containing protein, partial [Pirellula sp.]